MSNLNFSSITRSIAFVVVGNRYVQSIVVDGEAQFVPHDRREAVGELAQVFKTSANYTRSVRHNVVTYTRDRSLEKAAAKAKLWRVRFYLAGIEEASVVVKAPGEIEACRLARLKTRLFSIKYNVEASWIG